MEKSIYFTECEHAGDLSNYTDDLFNSGAKIISEKLNDEEETARVVIEVEEDEYNAFFKKFKKTDAYLFSSFYNSEDND